MTIKIKKIKKLHPDWWVQKSTSNCGHEIKIVCHAPDGHVPEHVKDFCCKSVKLEEI